MTRINMLEFTDEAASMAKGKEFKDVLEPLLKQGEEIVIDFSGISRFASPFFNNSFSALAIIYGFECVYGIKLENISKIGKDTFDSSMENAELLYDNPNFQREIQNIVNNAPKKVEC